MFLQNSPRYPKTPKTLKLNTNSWRLRFFTGNDESKVV